MELDYYEALGVEAPENSEAAGEHTEDAAPDTLESVNGEKQWEPADPAEEQKTESRGERKQTPEENARYAAIRRRAQQEAQRRAVQEMNELISTSGFVDPYTQKPISTWEELAAYRDKRQADKNGDFQETQGMDGAYRNFTNGRPAERDTRREMQKNAAEGAKIRLEQDVRAVSSMDPSVKSLADLAQRPEYPQICSFVEKGLSLPEAYKLVNFDTLSRRTAEATRQAALNAVNGKGHMRQSGFRGDGAVRVPSAVAEEYRMFVPDATNVEIQAHYNRYMTGH